MVNHSSPGMRSSAEHHACSYCAQALVVSRWSRIHLSQKVMSEAREVELFGDRVFPNSS